MELSDSLSWDTHKWALQALGTDLLADVIDYSFYNANVVRDGYAFIVTTVLKGKRVLRLCLLNGNTTTDDVIGTMDYLKKIALEIVESHGLK